MGAHGQQMLSNNGTETNQAYNPNSYSEDYSQAGRNLIYPHQQENTMCRQDYKRESSSGPRQDCMPRNYKQTTERAQWTANDLSAAITDVKNGKSIRKAAKDHGIPFSTLQERIKISKMSAPSLGRKAVFTHDQEANMVEHLKTISNMFYGLTPLQLRKLVFEYAEKLNIPHRFNKASRLAGKDWLEGFLRRNPRISARKPEATSLNRLKGFNKQEVTKFFDNLENVMEKFKFTPNKIFNMDETGITTVHETNKILAPKGQKRIGAATSGERGQTTTVICAFNAAGNYIPPVFIYARQRMAPTLKVNGPPNALYFCSKNGWTNEGLFVQWLQHLKKYSTPNEEEPVLLIIDNHGSHITKEAYDFCKENFITLLSLPPHSSHRLQPLDVIFYGPLKKAYNKECDLYMKTHANERITVYKVAELFNKAYTHVATLAKAISGFSCTGIFPMNPNVFSDEDFPLEIESTEVLTDAPSRSSQDVTIQDLSPLPVLSHPGPRSMHSEIWTATPKKAVLEEKKRNKEERLQQKNNQRENSKRKDAVFVRPQKRKLSFSSSSSEGNEVNLFQESGESDYLETGESESEDTLSKEFTLEIKPHNILVGDYLLVRVSNERSEKNFLSQAIEIGKNSIKVKFMCEYRGQWDTYVFPEVEDTSYVIPEDIVGKLTKFQQLRYGKVKFE